MPWSRLERIRTEAIYAAARYSRSRRVDIDPDGGWVVIYDFELPPYYNYETVDILIELPPDYPPPRLSGSTPIRACAAGTGRSCRTTSSTGFGSEADGRRAACTSDPGPLRPIPCRGIPCFRCAG
jgi:hypothetical protein